MIASGSQDTCVKISNRDTLETIETLYIGGNIYNVCFSPDGNFLLESNDAEDSDDDDDDREQYDADGNYINRVKATAGLKIFNVHDNFSINETLTLHINEISNIKKMCFSPDGKYLACSNSTTVVIFDVKDYTVLKTLEVEPDKLEGSPIIIAFSYDFNYLVIIRRNNSNRKNNIIFYHTSNFEEFKCIETNKTITEICFSPDGKYLAYQTISEIIILDINTYNILHELDCSSLYYDLHLYFSNDSKFLASISKNTVKIWNCYSLFAEVVSEILVGHHPTSLCFSNDNNFLAIGYLNTVIKIIDCDNNFTEIGELRGHLASINTIAFSPCVETLW